MINFLHCKFIKFNFIVRFGNAFLKTTIQYIKNKDKLCSFNNLISYYFYNIGCLIFTTFFIDYTESNLIQINSSVGSQLQIYTTILALICAIVYLGYTFNEKIHCEQIEIGKIGKILNSILIFLLSCSLYSIIYSYFNPILFASNDEYRLVCQNTQYNYISNNSIEQENAYNPTNYLNNSSGFLDQSSNSSSSFYPHNNQGSVNTQNTIFSRSASINFKGNKIHKA